MEKRELKSYKGYRIWKVTDYRFNSKKVYWVADSGWYETSSEVSLADLKKRIDRNQ